MVEGFSNMSNVAIMEGISNVRRMFGVINDKVNMV